MQRLKEANLKILHTTIHTVHKVERFHSTLTEHLRLLNNESKEQVQIQIPKAIIAYNSTKHSATQFKPLEIINGHLEIQDYLELNINF